MKIHLYKFYLKKNNINNKQNKIKYFYTIEIFVLFPDKATTKRYSSFNNGILVRSLIGLSL